MPPRRKAKGAASPAAAPCPGGSDGAGTTNFSAGDQVVAHSLTGATELNGVLGRVVGPAGDRVQVDFGGAHGAKNVRPRNLRALNPDIAGLSAEKRGFFAAAAAASAAGGGGDGDGDERLPRLPSRPRAALRRTERLWSSWAGREKDLMVCRLQVVRCLDQPGFELRRAEQTLGVAISGTDDSGEPVQLPISALRWRDELGEWSAEEWAWYILALVELCEPMHTSSLHVILMLVNYKLQRKPHPDFSMDVNSAWKDLSGRFPRAAACTKATMWSDDDSMKRNDFAYAFDTGWFWRRCGELVGKPLADRTGHPAVTFYVDNLDGPIVGGKGAVVDCDGTVYGDLEEYVALRLRKAAPRAEAGELKRVKELMCEALRARRSPMDLVSGRDLKKRSQEEQARSRRVLHRTGEHVPEMAASLLSCSGCGARETPGVEFKRCKRCKAARYCSPECQTEHWPVHKGECRAPVSDQAKKQAKKEAHEHIRGNFWEGAAVVTHSLKEKRMNGLRGVVVGKDKVKSPKDKPADGGWKAKHGDRDDLRVNVDLGNEHGVKSIKMDNLRPVTPAWAEGGDDGAEKWWRRVSKCGYCGEEHQRNWGCSGHGGQRYHHGRLEVMDWDGYDYDEGFTGKETKRKSYAFGVCDKKESQEIATQFAESGRDEELLFQGAGRDNEKYCAAFQIGWNNAFRWTCCGVDYGRGVYGCDHHGGGPQPCGCDYCTAGTQPPPRKGQMAEGLTLSFGPDPRSVSEAGKANWMMRQGMQKAGGCEQQ